MHIIGISGWSGNGKTTLLTRLIPALKARGYRISTVKHAHHRFDIDIPGKDSHRHREAGASEVLISSAHRWALMHENRGEGEATLQDIIGKMTPVDFLLIEGFKSENFPKIEVWRPESDNPPRVTEDDSIIALATTAADYPARVPVLDLDNENEIADFIIDHFMPADDTPGGLSSDCFALDADMLRAEDALARISAAVERVVQSEPCPLDEAVGRVLAADIHSSLDLPPHDNSAVDGYACRYEDYAADPAAHRRVSGYSRAGHPFTGDAGNGVVKILTGAVMPQGFDTVAMIEHVRFEGDRIILPEGLTPGENRRRAGEDIQKGQLLLARGHRLRPQDIGHLASVGIAEIPLYKRLRVALFSTGDELLEPAAAPAPGRIHDSNRYMLLALLQSMGCEVSNLGILPDRDATIEAALKTACARHDLVITSGGVSMGDEDHVRNVLARIGKIHFWRIAIKPGRPLALGQIGDAAFVGLPGNPVSALVCSLIFLRPLLQKLSGAAISKPLHYPAIADFTFEKKPGRREWLRGRYTVSENGAGSVSIFPKQGSGVLSSMVWANGLVEIAEDCRYINKGDSIKFIPFTEFTR